MQIHDPGGKVRSPLPAGMIGSAEFGGINNCYRYALWRLWGDLDAPYALWIGMNPSTADATVNDPTITREINFTKRFGLTKYLKCNVSAYRATNPKILKDIDVPLDTLDNTNTILKYAKEAKMIIMSCGKLPTIIHSIGVNIVDTLTQNYELWSFGTTKDGFPKHTLYLRSDAELLKWKGF